MPNLSTTITQQHHHHHYHLQALALRIARAGLRRVAKEGQGIIARDRMSERGPLHASPFPLIHNTHNTHQQQATDDAKEDKDNDKDKPQRQADLIFRPNS